MNHPSRQDDAITSIGLANLRSLFMSAWDRSAFWPIAVVLGVICVAVWPVGDFPLNDDWAYAGTVRKLIEEGRYESSFMAAAFAQVFWGALVASLFGLSHTALRFSTLLLALAAMWATAGCARLIGLNRSTALLCSLLLLANPLFMNLAFTFMTDVPFVAFMMVSALFYARALSSQRIIDFSIATAFGLAAASTRQFGIAIPLAYGTAVCFDRIVFRNSSHWPMLLATMVLWLLAAGLYLFGPAFQNRPPLVYDPYALSTLETILGLLRGAGTAAIYAGLFVSPFALVELCAALRRPTRWRRWQWLAFPAVMAALSLSLFQQQADGSTMFRRLPLLGNILYDLGTGPLTLRDTYRMGMPGPLAIGSWWWPITVVGVMSGGVLTSARFLPYFFDTIATFRNRTAGPRTESDPAASIQTLFLFVLGAVLLFAPYGLAMGDVADRYLLPAVPLLAIFCGRWVSTTANRVRPVAGALLAALMLIFSTAATHDYLAWNRARWAGIQFLLSQTSAVPFSVDGGYEFNSVYTRDEYLQRSGASPHDEGPLGFWVLDDTYAISFNPRPGMAELKRMPYFSWLEMRQRGLLVLERSSSLKQLPPSFGRRTRRQLQRLLDE